MVQVVEHLSSKCVALSSSRSTTKKYRKEAWLKSLPSKHKALSSNPVLVPPHKKKNKRKEKK
jgi:hypothetical protein